MIEPKLTQVENTEIKRIFFLKTHKCASTTIQNILMRFGHQENLDFLLPNVKNYIGNPIHFNTNMVNDKYSPADGKFDMFVHHTRYSQEIKSVMRPGTVYITILREPKSLFESMYSFYHFEKKYKKNLIKFIYTSTKHTNRYFNRLGINQMMWDLGMVSDNFDNTKEITKHIQMVERDFSFVMIFEHLEASLVLLANLMKWPIERMAYLPHNTRNDTYKQKLSDNDLNQLDKINMADYMLYNRFVQKFKENINEYGLDKLKRGIGKLIAINKEMIEKCVKSITNKGYAQTISYELKESDQKMCKYIAINELKYTSFLRDIQYEKQRKYKSLDELMNNN